MYHGMSNSMENLFRLSNAQSRSISPENYTGAKGGGAMCELEDGSARAAARDLGKGWKVNPFVRIPAGETFTVADITGPRRHPAHLDDPHRQLAQHHHPVLLGTIRRPPRWSARWATSSAPAGRSTFRSPPWRCASTPAAPLTATGPCPSASGAASPWRTGPRRKWCTTTRWTTAWGRCPEDAAYFHAQFRRVNPLPYKQVYTILDGVKGQGQYVGTYMPGA